MKFTRLFIHSFGYKRKNRQLGRDEGLYNNCPDQADNEGVLFGSMLVLNYGLTRHGQSYMLQPTAIRGCTRGIRLHYITLALWILTSSFGLEYSFNNRLKHQQ